MQDAEADLEQRVLVVAPTPRDGQITHALLAGEHLPCLVCRSLIHLTQELTAGAGALLVTDEVLTAGGIDQLLSALHRQPAWSDLPVILLMPGGAQSDAAGGVLRQLGNVTLLERPARIRSLVSAVQAALRARQRQYQARAHIDAIRRAEEEREQLLESERNARADAEKAGRMKDEFLANLSHELRTPLNAILGWSQLIRRAPDASTLDEGLSVIERNARVQVQLIEDLLDVSRIISGKIRLNIRLLDPASFIDAAIETVTPAAEAKGVHLQKTLERGLGLVSGDPNRLQQVVWNLLSNAIKFTPPGGRVEVAVEQVDSHLEIRVSDTGQGIRPEFLPHVFERFRQADASSTKAHGGLGLGLAIVKHLVELHEGAIRATSPGLGQGSTFSISLPLADGHRRSERETRELQTASAERIPGCEAASLEGLSILVVDDEPDARALVRRVLEECRAKVFAAGSAAEALKLLEDEHPDILVSDIGLPQVDGYEFLKRVRSLGAGKGGNLPAIALTAFARSEDRTRALLAGYLVHVSKPVEPQELIATVASVAGRIGTKPKL